jgi:DNA polymerase-1
MAELIIIDGHNYLFRAFAVPYKFYSSRGNPLHVVTAYLSLLRRSVQVVGRNSLMAVVFDSESSNDNSRLDPQYKANRRYEFGSDEQNPFVHLPIIKQVLDQLSIPWVEETNIEADDQIASLTYNMIHTRQAAKVYIASSDSDFFQLLSPQINVIKLQRGGVHELLDHNWLRLHYGVQPEQYVELKAWVGDKADNIPGISGIGWKRGAEIINGSRTRVLDKQESERLMLNRKLIRLSTSSPVTLVPRDANLLLDRSNRELFAAAGL